MLIQKYCNIACFIHKFVLYFMVSSYSTFLTFSAIPMFILCLFSSICFILQNQVQLGLLQYIPPSGLQNKIFLSIHSFGVLQIRLSFFFLILDYNDSRCTYINGTREQYTIFCKGKMTTESELLEVWCRQMRRN